MKRYQIIILVMGLLMMFNSCTEETISMSNLDAEQLIAGRIDGTWANPSNIVTPNSVPPEIFGNMRLVFTTDAKGYPAQFIAKECPIVFSSYESSWSVTGTDSNARVSLADVSPVDEMNVTVTSTSLTLSFYMGWENTETGETGEGNFSVTLTRK